MSDQGRGSGQASRAGAGTSGNPGAQQQGGSGAAAPSSPVDELAVVEKVKPTAATTAGADRPAGVAAPAWVLPFALLDDEWCPPSRRRTVTRGDVEFAGRAVGNAALSSSVTGGQDVVALAAEYVAQASQSASNLPEEAVAVICGFTRQQEVYASSCWASQQSSILAGYYSWWFPQGASICGGVMSDYAGRIRSVGRHIPACDGSSLSSAGGASVLSQVPMSDSASLLASSFEIVETVAQSYSLAAKQVLHEQDCLIDAAKLVLCSEAVLRANGVTSALDALPGLGAALQVGKSVRNLMLAAYDVVEQGCCKVFGDPFWRIAFDAARYELACSALAAGTVLPTPTGATITGRARLGTGQAAAATRALARWQLVGGS
jgi:hypothetical protein